jgi:hypothetical protein
LQIYIYFYINFYFLESTVNFTAFSPKNDRELIEARTKIKSLEISKDNLDLKVGRLEAENKSLELKNRELGLQIEVFFLFHCMFLWCTKSKNCSSRIYCII